MPTIENIDIEDAASKAITLLHLMEGRMALPDLLEDTHRHGLSLLVEEVSESLAEAAGLLV